MTTAVHGPQRGPRGTRWAPGAFVSVIALVAALLLGSCSGAALPPVIHVVAASSLQDVLPPILRAYERSHPGVVVAARFDDSQTLATQILEGEHADVFVSADAAPVARLAGAAKVTRSAPLVENGLVIAVRRVSLLESVDDLAAPGVRIAVGEAGTPLAALTARALGRLDPKLATALRAHVAVRDPDAGVLMSHVDLGEADAAFVYRTDLAQWPDEREITLPAGADLTANRYVVAELAGGAAQSASVVDYLLGASARAAFTAAGFRPVHASAAEVTSVPTATP